MNIFGLAKSFINPANLAMLAMGPAGWAGIAARAVMSAVGQQIIQKLGEQLGLPQAVIDGAQATFCAACGDKSGVQRNIREASSEIAREFNLSPIQQGRIERAANQDVRNAVDFFTNEMSKGEDARTARAGGGKSWLMAIAKNLGQVADKLAGEMETLSKTIGDGDKKASQNLEFGAKSQEFSQFFSSANTVIKTIGEALSAGARKQ